MVISLLKVSWNGLCYIGQFAVKTCFIISFKFYFVVGNVNYFCGHNTLHCRTLHTTLLFGPHFIVVRSGFVLSFVSNLKTKPSGHSFWCGFPIFHLHTKLHFSVLFFGVFRAHTKLVFRPGFLVFHSSTQLGFRPHVFSVEHTTSARTTLFFSLFQSHTIFYMVAIN